LTSSHRRRNVTLMAAPVRSTSPLPALAGRYGLPVDRAPSQTEFEAARGRIARDLLSSEYARARVLAMAGAGRGSALGAPEVRTPGEVLGERNLLLATLLTREDIDVRTAAPLSPRVRIMLALTSLVAPAYLWTNAITEIAQDTPVPPHVIAANLLPYDAMWWTYEGAAGDLQGSDFMRDAALLRNVGGFVEVIFFGASTSGPALRGLEIPLGARFPDDIAARYTDANVRPVEQMLASLAFLASPYADATERRPSRAERRRDARAPASVPPGIESVRFIDLRVRRDQEGRDDDAGRVAWMHSWWVSGHNRAQWYPSRQEHQLIWIGPYLKGPADKPLLATTYRVKR
jgi:hypothetical protein